MRALTLHGVADIRYQEVPDPVLMAPDDAIVQVTLCALCGSDLHPYRGTEPGYDCGMVPGHEFVGTVVECGASVRQVRVGDAVHVPFTTSCGDCDACRRGLTARCKKGELLGWRQDGTGLHGGQAEYVRVPMADSTLVLIAEGLSEVEALLLGDVLSTGFHGALMALGGEAAVLGEHGDSGGAGDVQSRNLQHRVASTRTEIGSRTVAVVGCGPVGLMAIVGARELGADRIVAFDPVAGRRTLAQGFGAEVSPPLDNGALMDISSGGFGAVIEAVGSAQSTRMAFDALRPGGVLASVGVHTRPDFGFTPVEAYDKNLTLRMGRCSARALMERLVPVALSGRYDLASVVTHRLALEEGAAAYRMVDGREAGCAKVVLVP